MKGKTKLRDRREWIEDDLIEKERRISWLLKREADSNKREGKQVRIKYMKIWIEEKLWVWEVKDDLREWQRREVRKEEKGIKKGSGEEKEEALGWSILNGSIKGDEEGEWTYTGGIGGTVIDYRGRRGVWTEEGKKKFREYVEKKGSGCKRLEEESKTLKRRVEVANNRLNICIESFDK
ncbi:hypothetical protein P5V15_014110 [Pogonomyrmex californicus]